MIKTLIVADDSTGANASAILLNKLNFSTLSLIEYDHASMIRGYDAVAVSTDSRATEATTAFERVENVLKTFSHISPNIINKRIDSTLRGNIGAELNAFVKHYKKRKIAMVPAFPNSKRTCKDGRVYVNAIPLEETDVAKDPKMPLHTSNAKDILHAQFNGQTANIYLSDIHSQGLVDKIKTLFETHDAIIFDAVTNNDIMIISQALVEAKHSMITVDPGPLTYYYTKAMIQKSERIHMKRYLYLVGSVTDTTYEQIKHIQNDDMFDLFPISAQAILDGNTETIATDLLKKLTQTSKPFILITTSDPNHRELLDLFEIAQSQQTTVDQLSKQINNGLATILETLLSKTKNIGGVFSSGGDITLSFLHNTEADGIHLLNQVMPLCVYGKIVGGRFDGLPLITKGGMIGEHDAYSEIKEFFMEVDNYE